LSFEAKEIQKLDTVNKLIKEQIDALAAELINRRKELSEANREIWSETPVIDDMDDILNLTALSLEIAQHERQYAQTQVKISELKSLRNSPYFARIDFTEEGFSDLEEIYIGKHSLYDGKLFHVYDWRAPISSLYYDYGVGKAAFDVVTDKGTHSIKGEISLKRQYHIVNGELVYLFDSELSIEDDILQLELSRASDARIKSIIHTIQKEQNKAIRSDAARLLVFGPAGSGKTSVGLHRLAYLLYRHRGKLSSAKVRIFSPNSIFASYIDGIIPELGEESVQTLDFPALIKSYNKPVFYDSAEHYNFLQAATAEDARRKWLQIKLSADFVKFVENYIDTYKPNLDEDIVFNKDIVCEGQRISELYKNRTSAGNLLSKTDRVLEFIQRSHDEYYEENKKDIAEFFDNLNGEIHSANHIRYLFDEQLNTVLADFRNRLIPPSERLYERIIKAWAKKNNLSGAGANIRQLKQDKILYEDTLLLFYIDILSGRIKKDKEVRHILIDEAQDMGYLQHRILQNLYDCQFTVLADVNQALFEEIHITKEEDLTALYPNITVEHLTTSYRSTYEISSFAAGILGKDSAGDSLYKRSGEKPQTFAGGCAEVCNIIEGLPESFNTVGILFSSAKKAAEFFSEFKEAYKGKRELNLINSYDDAFLPGIMVMAVTFAKGLEFDAVICPESGSFAGDIGKKLLYLICTRALHRLYLHS